MTEDQGEAHRFARTSTCAGCGAPFGCGVDQGICPCWCAALPALAPVPDACAGARCLCPACLERQLNSPRHADVSVSKVPRG